MTIQQEFIEERLHEYPEDDTTSRYTHATNYNIMGGFNDSSQQKPH